MESFIDSGRGFAEKNQFITVKLVENKGRCLFACQDFGAYIEIESAPIIEFDSFLTNYFLDKPCGEKVLAWRETESGEILSSAVACGLMMMCSHSDNPNAFIERDLENGTAILISIKEIKKGQEITVLYKIRKTF